MISNTVQRAERRRRLAELDGLLGELEWLNLADRLDVPEDLATRLEKYGIRAASRKRPFQLIEDIFDLQRPFLRPNPTAIRTQEPAPRRPQAVDGWVFV